MRLNKKQKIQARIKVVIATIFALFLLVNQFTFDGAGRMSIISEPLHSAAPTSSQFIRPIANIDKPYVPNQVIVKYKESQAPHALFFKSSIVSEFRSVGVPDLETVEEIPEDDIILFESTDLNAPIEEVIAKIESHPDVEYAQPNFIYQLDAIPTNDPGRIYQWALDNTGQTVNSKTGISDADLDAPEAWDISEGGENEVVVAVIDTGVAYDHPDLTGQMWDGSNCVDKNGSSLGGCQHGYDFAYGDKNPMMVDSAHGTSVAGVIAATKGNGEGIIGIAPRAKIMAIAAGGSAGLTTIDIINSIKFATQNGASIINASFGGIGNDCSAVFDQMEYKAIQSFPGLFVTSAGNSSTDHNSSGYFQIPADYGHNTSCWQGLSNIITVAATDQSDDLASFSDYGSSFVDVAAPGQNIYTTTIAGASQTGYSEDFQNITIPDLPASWTTPPGGDWGTYDFGGGAKVLYSNLNRPYAASSDTTVISPTVDLSAAESAIAEFVVACDTEYNATDDYLSLEVSSDGIIFDSIASINEFSIDQAFGDSSDIGRAAAMINLPIPTVDLTSGFKFRFRWITDADTDTGSSGEGCLIDDFKLNTTGIKTATYKFMGGTSFSAPYVAGVAALVWGHDQTLTRDQVKSIILNSGDSLSSLTGKTVTGKRVNANRALKTPVVRSVTAVSASGSYGLDQTIELAVNFSSPVATSGVPTLLLSMGRSAGFTRVEGNSLIFSYTVQIGDAALDLGYANSLAIALNGGAITAAGDTTLPALLGLPVPGSAGSLSVNADITFDAAGPAAPVILSIAGDNQVNITEDSAIIVVGTAESDSLVTVTLTDVEGDVISGTQQLAGGATDFAITLDGTIAQPAALTDGMITLNATATDSARNVGTSIGVQDIVLDTIVPTLTVITTDTTSGIYKVGDTINFQFQFSEPVSLAGELRIRFQNGIGISLTSIDGVDMAIQDYVIQSGDNTVGLTLGEFGLASGSLRDATGNDLANIDLNQVGISGFSGIVIDTLAPAMPVVAAISGDNKVGTTEKSAIIITGTAEADSFVSVELTDENYNLISGTQQLAGGATDFAITLDGTAAQPQSLSDGKIIAKVSARDAVGNQSIPTSSFEAYQDANPPVLTGVTLALGNRGGSYARVGDVIVLNITANKELASLTANIASQQALVSGLGKNFLASVQLTAEMTEGPLAFSVTARDDGGNETIISATTDDSSIVFDKTLPAQPILTSANFVNSSKLCQVVGTADVGSLITATIIGAQNQSVGSQQLADTEAGFSIEVDCAGLLDGSYQLEIMAADAAGNVSTVATDSINIDTTGPSFSDITVTSSNTNSTYAKTGDTVTLTIQTGEVVAGVAVSIAGQPVNVTGSGQNFVASYTFQGDEAEGLVGIYVKTNDSLGNPSLAGAVTDDSGVIFDKTAPVVEIQNLEDGEITNSLFSLKVLVSEVSEPVVCSYDLDAKGMVEFTKLEKRKKDATNLYRQPFSNLIAGEHTASVSCRDVAGNVSSTKSVTWKVEPKEIVDGSTDDVIISDNNDGDGEAGMSNGVVEVTLRDDTELDVSTEVKDVTASDNVTIGGITEDLAEFSHGDLDKVDLSVPVNVGGQAVSIKKAVSVRSGKVGESLTIKNANLNIASVALPDSTSIFSSSDWDGRIVPPRKVASSGIPPVDYSIGSTVIEAGSANVVLLFDQAVTLTLSGITGDIGYKSAGSSSWRRIMTTCGGTYAAPENPTFPGECVTTDGADTKIVTYHFTAFATLDKIIRPSGGSSGGGGGGGGGGVNTTSVYTIPNTESKSILNLIRPLSLKKIDGALPRSIRISNYYQKHVLALLQGTKLTTNIGQRFTGTLEVPREVTQTKLSAVPAGGKFIIAVQVGVRDLLLTTSQPYAIKIILPNNLKNIDLTKLKAYYYDPVIKDYKLAGDGGALSGDQKSFITKSTKLSTIALLEVDGEVAQSITVVSNSKVIKTATESVSQPQPVVISSSASASFTDIDNHWAARFIETLAGEAVFQRSERFRPNDPIIRAELAKVIVKTFGLPLPAQPITETGFSDIPSDVWYAPFVVALRDAGVAGGYADGTFRPSVSVNRAEALKMFIKAGNLARTKEYISTGFADVPADAWYAPFVYIARHFQIVSGYDEIAPEKLFTRKLQIGHQGEDVKLLQEMLKEQGYWFVAVNGHFDRNTQKAVARFQSKFPQREVRLPDGLGAAGENTVRKLLELTGKGGLASRTVFRPAQVITRAEVAKLAIRTREEAGR